mgnify:FL=1
MALADILAQIGGRTAVGEAGRIFGGETDREKIAREFQEKQLPILTENVRKATTLPEITKAAGQLLELSRQAGAGP